VSGHVTDNSGAIIAAAHIALTNRDTGVSREIDSTDGAYHFQPVLPGHYDLTVTASGFARKTVTDLIVTLGAHLGQDISLSVGGTSDLGRIVSAATPFTIGRLSEAHGMGPALVITSAGFLIAAFTASSLPRS
jgi:hypothetical protein